MRQITRLLSVMLVVASLLFSLTMPVQITHAESEPGRAVEPSVLDDGLPAEIDPAVQSRIKKAYGQLPLSFEANRGQTNRAVKFLSRGAGYTLFLTPAEAVLSLRDDRASQAAVLRMKLAGANPQPQLSSEDQLPGKSNYLIGNDPRKWQRNVPHYKKVSYTTVY